MTKSCAVATCKIRYGCEGKRERKNGVSFFRFPREKKMYDIWAVKSKIGHNFKAQKAFICSEHFTTDDYDQGYLLKKKLMPDCKQAPTLKHDAIPSTNQMFSWP